MKNVFTAAQNYVNKPNRNKFDLSFYNNLTLNMGQYIPVFCKEVMPADTFRIKPSFGLRLQPLVFPIQTNLKASLHFFYVRNRNLWKGWQDFITGTGSTSAPLEPPYLSTTKKDSYKVGSLADYLGVPVSYYGKGQTIGRLEPDNMLAPSMPSDKYGYNMFMDGDYNAIPTSGTLGEVQALRWYSFPRFVKSSSSNTCAIMLKMNSSDFTGVYTEQKDYLFYLGVANTGNTEVKTLSGIHANFYACPTNKDSSVPENYTYCGAAELNCTAFADYEGAQFKATLSSSDVQSIYSAMIDVGSDVDVRVIISCAWLVNKDYADNVRFLQVMAKRDYTSRHDVGEMVDCPYMPKDKNTKPAIPLSALPFRAYESIYNSFYRDDRNNPRVVNGKAEYNLYLENVDGGADSFDYELRPCTFYPDRFTTATQTPVLGNVPLVGISSLGEMKFQDENGSYTAQAKFAADGETIESVTFSENSPTSLRRELIQQVSQGISINDFRNVNAYQRWLEKNVRRGLKYRDQIMSHFGVDVSYQELDMPEFIGGMSRNIPVSEVYQTSETSLSPLGDFAGRSTFADEGQSISHYCDEHGFIIGIFFVMPDSVYSQTLSPMFSKLDKLDYFFPEFGHIGPQSIDNREVSPLQAFYDPANVGKDDVTTAKNRAAALNKTFGYQRAWYDLVSSLDSAHGEFQSSLSNFLIHRVFENTPLLNESFLCADPKDFTEVFAVQDVTHKIMGQIYFDVEATRPIPTLSVPRLETND